MPLLRYLGYVGGVLLMLILVADAYLPKLPAAQTSGPRLPVIHIYADRKGPERVVYDTSVPMNSPAPAVSADAGVPAQAAVVDVSSRVREAFGQLQPSDAGTVQSLSHTFGVQDVVRVRERIAYLDALREMCNASALLLLQSEEFRHAVPAKTYEYLRSGRPIVALATPDGESARLLRQFAGVFLAPPDDASEVGACLETAHRAWRAAQVFDRSTQQLGQYSRRSVAASLAKILDRTRAPETGDGRGRA